MATEKKDPVTSFTRVFFHLLAIALIGIAVWIFFSFPRLSAVSLKIDRYAALNIARDYLRDECGVSWEKYHTASIFLIQDNVDTFLQRVLGTKGESEFLKKYDYDLFYWKVRFFRPGEKEEYLVYISSRTGEVIQYRHIIEETAARADMTKEKARKIAEEFLINKAGVRLDEYVIKDEVSESHDKRVEFGFYWRHKDVEITWARLPKGDKAKLLTGAIVTGGEVRAFYKIDLSVPDAFFRYLDKEMEVGHNLSSVFDILYKLLIIIMIVQLINCRQHLAMRTVRPVLIRISIILGAIAFISTMNHAESIMMGYPTSQDFNAYWGRTYFNSLQQAIFPSIALIMMALAAEAVHSRAPIFPDGRGSFLSYARSNFMTRKVAYSIIYGNLLACFFLGVQSLIFAFGETFFGVWMESRWLTEFSSAYWPFLAAIFIGLRASLLEEITFRVFALHWFKIKLNNILLAVIISSVIWGFGHTGYHVFPMWFRGLEVTLLGFLFCWAYLRFGLLTVLVAHYLFDAFWTSAGSLFSPSAPIYFWSSLAVLSLPMLWAAIAWFLNKSSVLRELDWSLNPAQKFHLQVLEAFVERSTRDGANLTNLKQLCLNHSWDPAVVEKAFASRTDEFKDIDN